MNEVIRFVHIIVNQNDEREKSNFQNNGSVRSSSLCTILFKLNIHNNNWMLILNYNVHMQYTNT